MREFIDDGELRLARDDRVDVHLLEGHAAVRNLEKRDKFEVADAGGSFGAAVRLDKTKHDVVSLFTELMSFFEHAVGFPYACRAAEIDFELSLFCVRYKVEESFGIFAILIVHCARRLPQDHDSTCDYKRTSQQSPSSGDMMKQQKRDHLRHDEKDYDIAAHQPAEIQVALVDQHAVGDEARGARRDDPGAKLQSLPHQGEAPDFEQRGANQKSKYSNQCDCSSSINSFHADVMGGAEIVQRQVELEHVDAGLAQNAGPSRARMVDDQRADGIFAQPAYLGDALHLEFSSCRTDVRVEAAAGGGDHADRDLGRRNPGVLLEELFQALLRCIDKRLVGRAKVRPTGAGRVVALVAGRRSPAMKVARR